MRVNCPGRDATRWGEDHAGAAVLRELAAQLGTTSGPGGRANCLAVVADAGNTASGFKTNLPARGDSYWVGAELTMRSGTQAGCRLKVTGYTASTGVVTVSGALAGVPAAGDQGIVDHRGRLLASAGRVERAAEHGGVAVGVLQH